MDVLMDSMLDAELVPPVAHPPELATGYQVVPRRDLGQTHALQAGRRNVEHLLRKVLEDDHARLVLNYRNAGANRVGVRLGSGVNVPSLMHLSAGQSLLF